MRRWGKSNEISKLVGFLLSDKSIILLENNKYRWNG